MTEGEKTDRPYNGPDGKFRSGNPGRPNGSKHKLGMQFFDDFYRDFMENGAAVIVEVRQNRPTEYLRIAASVIPKELVVTEGNPFDHLSDDELAQMVRHEAAALGIEAEEAEPTVKLNGQRPRRR